MLSVSGLVLLQWYLLVNILALYLKATLVIKCSETWAGHQGLGWVQTELALYTQSQL